MSDPEPERPMTEPTEIRLSLADLLAELALGAMAREVEMDEGAEVSASTSVATGELPAQPS
jgi:hypothetical protein